MRIKLHSRKNESQALSHHRRSEEQRYIQGQRDLQNHSNASIEQLCQSREYSWCPPCTRSQTSSLFLLFEFNMLDKKKGYLVSKITYQTFSFVDYTST